MLMSYLQIRRRGTFRVGFVVVAIGVPLALVWFFGPFQDAAPTKARAQVPFPDGLPDPTVAIPKQANDGEFVSSKECRSCHPEAYDSWHKTYHRTMTQMAGPDAVVGDFNNVEMEYIGIKYRLERRGDEFWVTMPDLDWLDELSKLGADPSQVKDPPMVDRKVVMTTGSHHFQGYWVASRNADRLRLIPFYYHIDSQRWVPKIERFLGSRHHLPIAYDFSYWDHRCIACHSVGGNPGMNPDTEEFSTEVGEFGIACEACHGPGRKHIEFHLNDTNQTATNTEADATIVNPAKRSHKLSSEICGQCHSVALTKDQKSWLLQGSSYRAGDDLEETHDIMRFETLKTLGKKWEQIRPYWGDGTFRAGGREFNAMSDSTCFTNGTLSCLSCHSLHRGDPNDLLRPELSADQTCLQCHDKIGEDIAGHTHHLAGSTGSTCQNCHMPHTSFALLTAIRSHRIASPRVTETIETASPNACNLCHLDRTLAWSSRYLSQWYDAPEVGLDDDEQTIAASLLWLSSGDAVYRAVTAWHFGWKPAQNVSGTEWMPPFLLEISNDDYSAVRYVANRSLNRLPTFQAAEFDYLAAESDRTRIIQLNFEAWRQRNWKPSRQRAARLLMDSTGSVQKREFERLKQLRDKTPIMLPE